MDRCGGGGPKFGKRKVSKNAPCPDEENEPIGETIESEMAKRTRYKHTERKKERKTIDAFVNRFILPYINIKSSLLTLKQCYIERLQVFGVRVEVGVSVSAGASAVPI